ncbi:MAG TPA: hypothetical protein VMT93_06930 [Gemmatimonadaceae bacterium]|nr:hypothetical protein [Gemmatimonadaceae bacterium]
MPRESRPFVRRATLLAAFLGAPAWAPVAVMPLAPAAAAQGAVSLRIRPRAGDTIRTRYERDVVMTALTKVNGKDTSLVTSTSTLILARLIVQTSDAAGCTMLAVTDSVATLTLGSQALSPGESVRRAMQGRRVLLRVAPDGASSVVSAPGDLDAEVGAFVQALPSVLPGGAVAPGATWQNAIAVPVAGETGAGRGARLRVQYRLDSLTNGGALAYVALHGRITRDSADGTVRGGARMGSNGEITGAMVLDRRLGWWAASAVTVTLRSVITPAPGNDAPPVRVETRITQRLRTEPAGRAGAAPPG